MYQTIHPWLPHDLNNHNHVDDDNDDSGNDSDDANDGNKTQILSSRAIEELAMIEYKRDAPSGVLDRARFKLSFFELADR
jgi:hypothetical protein